VHRAVKTLKYLAFTSQETCAQVHPKQNNAHSTANDNKIQFALLPPFCSAESTNTEYVAICFAIRWSDASTLNLYINRLLVTSSAYFQHQKN